MQVLNCCSKIGLTPEEFYEKFRINVEKLSPDQNSIYTIENYQWYRQNILNSNSWIYLMHEKNADARNIAEILCPMGYVILVVRGIVYVTKFQFPVSYYHQYEEQVPKSPLIYISAKYLPPSLYTAPPPVMDAVLSTKHDFLKQVRWKFRRVGLLLALRWKNGKYYHVLKWLIASWL